MFTCDLYAGSPLPHDLERLRMTMQRRVVDFVRVGYFIPLNGPLNGHPPSINYRWRVGMRGSLSSAETFVASWYPAGRGDNDWILLYPHVDVNLKVIGPTTLHETHVVTCLCGCAL